jgi:hypothetical protein
VGGCSGNNINCAAVSTGCITLTYKASYKGALKATGGLEFALVGFARPDTPERRGT